MVSVCDPGYRESDVAVTWDRGGERGLSTAGMRTGWVDKVYGEKRTHAVVNKVLQ